MKHNLFALGLISILTGLAGPHSGVAQDSSASYTVNPVSPSDAGPAAAAIKSWIEALGLRRRQGTCRATAPASGTPMS